MIKLNILKNGAILLVALFLSGCIFYKTDHLKYVDKFSLDVYSNTKKYWLVDDVEGNRYVMHTRKLYDDSLVTRLAKTNFKDHPDGKEKFRKGKSDHPKDYFHVKVNKPLKIGENKIAYSEVVDSYYHESDVKKNAAVNGVIVGVSVPAVLSGFVVGFFYLFTEVICQCPSISIIGENEILPQGSLFPGALSKNLERTDFLLLDTLVLNENNNLELNIENPRAENEYIRQLKVYEITSSNKQMYAIDSKDNLVQYLKKDKPLLAYSSDNTSFIKAIEKDDTLSYDFNDKFIPSKHNELILEFPKSDKNQDSIYLLVKGKQSLWMDQVAQHFFTQLGKGFDQWQNRLNSIDASKYSENIRKRGISLSVSGWNGNEWEYQNKIENIGTLDERTRLVKIKVPSTDENIIRIKLSGAYKFWEINEVAIISDFQITKSFEELKVINVKVNNKSVNNELLSDKSMINLSNEGDQIKVTFTKPKSIDSKILVVSKGYYNYQFKSEQPTNKDYIKKMQIDPITTHQISYLLYQKAKKVN